MILENNGIKMIIGKDVPETDAPAVPREDDKKALLYRITESVRKGGFDPVSQLVGFIVSDDPTHISNCNNARTLINRIDRDELLFDMVRSYLDSLKAEYGDDSEDENDD